MFPSASFQSTTVDEIEKYSEMVIRYSAKFHNDNSTLISRIYIFYLAGNIVLYTPSQGTKREKYINHINYKGTGGWLQREIITFPSISSLIGCVFSIFQRKKHEPNPSETDININLLCLLPRRHNE